jgi:hypothetical protein
MSRIDLEHGGCPHEAWVERETAIGPVVMLANTDDGFYQQTFRSREELQSFVDQLMATANEAWPNSPTNPPQNQSSEQSS